MRYDLNIRESVRAKVEAMAAQMQAWQVKPRIDVEEATRIRTNIRSFSHTTTNPNFRIGGVDGSGDYPSFSYADSFVYVASASGTVFEVDAIHGLREELVLPEPTLEFVWLPENTDQARERWLAAFTNLAGEDVTQIIESSDYRNLKATASRRGQPSSIVLEELVLPRASDVANVGIQLRSVAEYGTALRLIRSKPRCDLILMDTTLTLPLVGTKNGSLFYEHVKRLCCVEAWQRGMIFATLSKSHGLPAIDQIEALAAEAAGLAPGRAAEHWHLRLPLAGHDNWQLSLVEGRTLPPVGAVTYLFRTHKNVPVLRLDLDRTYWEAHLREDPAAEARLFAQLDYAGHDQRAYGYPYPIKACHDRARLSMAERAALKKQVISAAVAAGMNPAAFRDVSQATGHS